MFLFHVCTDSGMEWNDETIPFVILMPCMLVNLICVLVIFERLWGIALLW